MNLLFKTMLLILLAVFAFFANSQIIPDPLSLVASPSAPSAGEKVTVLASTPTIDKEATIFSWTVDGKSRPDLSGQGKYVITLAAGSVGSAISVRVDISGSRGETGSAALSIPTADLALVWFAETYVPRWYKGKALPTQSSTVNIVAISNIKNLQAENLIYRWSLDDEDNILAGAGKQIFRIQLSDLPKATHHIRVKVEDASKTISKEGELFIISTSPRVAIYPLTPLGGIEHRSAPAFFSSSVRGQLDFTAEPFFFSVSAKKELSYQWSIAGGEAVGTAEAPYILSLNTGDSPVGVAPISVSIKPLEQFISTVSKTLTLLLQ